jgi:adenosylcobinamide-phosphate synthase
LNYIPARLSLPLIACVAAFVPQCSAAKAWRMGLSQHALLPSPNSGWSEAAMAGAIQRRLVGPIWMNGALVTDIWIGDMSDSPASSHEDTVRALMVAIVAGLLSALVAGAALMLAY